MKIKGATRKTVGLVVAGALGIVTACGSTGPTATGSCVDRTIVVDLSSSSRSDNITRTATELVPEALFSAGVCKRSITVVAVAGGTQSVLLSEADLAAFDFLGPNERARSTNASGQFGQLVDRATAALNDAYASTSGLVDSDAEALLQAVADHSGAGQAIILTAGVHVGESTLNRPLEDGEGALIAASIIAPIISPDVEIIIVGAGQPASETPAPGGAWTREVRSFLEALCKATGARSCTTYADAGASTLLQHGEPR